MTTPHEAARTYLGVKYRHCGRHSFSGIDCIGLLQLVASDLGVSNRHDLRSYSRLPRNFRIIMELKAAGLTMAERPEPGKVGIFFMIPPKDGQLPQPSHAGIFGTDGNRLTLIHTYMEAGEVVETGFDDYWQKRLHSVMSFPGGY